MSFWWWRQNVRVGKTISFRGKDYTVISIPDAISERPDIALFSAGGGTSLEWAPKFAEVGTTVIDNSSAWRMDLKQKTGCSRNQR
jgi:aspartate-semialdehyde dehydrogenase